MMREVLRLDTNVPIIAALKFHDGVTVQGRYGDQVMYTVDTAAGERVLYVPPIVRSKIEAAGLRAGDWFRLAKLEVRNGTRRQVEWRVEPVQPEEEVPGATNAEPLPQPSARLNAQPKPTTLAPTDGKPEAPAAPAPTAEPAQDSATPGHPRTKLEDALKTVVAACHAANIYAKEIGFQMPPFSADEIARMAMTLVIEARANGGAR